MRPKQTPPEIQEWLVTDRQGAFAMGTAEGFRTRKYHGFYLGIAGRSETSFLADLELSWNGQLLWPHTYGGDQGPVLHPEVSAEFHLNSYPSWTWRLTEGVLTLHVEPQLPGGIALRFGFKLKAKTKTASTAKSGAKSKSKTQSALPSGKLRLRPFFAMRGLHSNGGQMWSWDPLEARSSRIVSSSGSEVRVGLKGHWEWKEDPLWYRNFFYTEEEKRGYLAHEDLYSAGALEIDFISRVHAGSEVGILVSENPQHVESYSSLREDAPAVKAPKPFPAQDFILQNPAGIVAGYPWFGEWGRDTFVSLPGIVSAWLAAGGDSVEVWDWTHEILTRWGEWIQRAGMLPNLIEKEGTHQWESSDATLWWCHSLASLWMLSLGEPRFLGNLQEQYRDLLNLAIDSIHEGRHPFLKLNAQGLLEVTEAHTTWMDARVEGAPVTPRTGVLPEINALWFQARCLQSLWAVQEHEGRILSREQLEQLARLVLHESGEIERSNRIFLHSIPLAPSHFLQDEESLGRDLARVTEKFWTPVGLRTLDPSDARYIPTCCGTQENRDRAYHQGAVWGWLGGHYEMAKARLKAGKTQDLHSRTFGGNVLHGMPIHGHLAEIFDADAPYTPRGAPAQAWSLACFEEAIARKKLRLDPLLTQALAQRWLRRHERSGTKGSKGSRNAKGSVALGL